MIELKNVCAGYNGTDVLRDISMTAAPGRLLILIGPNGSGKSTLLRCMAGLHPITAGELFLDARNMKDISGRERARYIAYMPQTRPLPALQARRMVLHGRFPWLSWPRRYGRSDWEAADASIEAVHASGFAERLMTELSGGQRQSIYLAMALAQGTDTILMDEPAAWLDIGHQLELMRMARQWSAQGKSVVMVLHDLLTALRYADELAVLQDGRLVTTDTPENVMKTDCLKSVFGVEIGETDRHYYYREA